MMATSTVPIAVVALAQSGPEATAVIPASRALPRRRLASRLHFRQAQGGGDHELHAVLVLFARGRVARHRAHTHVLVSPRNPGSELLEAGVLAEVDAEGNDAHCLLQGRDDVSDLLEVLVQLPGGIVRGVPVLRQRNSFRECADHAAGAPHEGVPLLSVLPKPYLDRCQRRELKMSSKAS